MRLGLPGAGLALLLLAGSGCGPKNTRLDVPPGYLDAKTATPEQLIEIVNRHAQVGSLAVTRFSVEFTGGSLEQGYLKEYPRAKGYLVVQAPDSIFLNILNPLTSSTVVTMAAHAGRFQIWIPRENKYLIGRTDLKTEDENPLYNVRPDHMLEALLIEPLPVDSPGQWLVVAEEQDPRFKYYTLDVVSRGRGSLGCLRRRIWIERSQLRLARQQYYDCGQPVSWIDYRAAVELDGLPVNTDVVVNRAREHYRMHLSWKPDAVRLNPTLRSDTFQVPQPPGAELIEIENQPESADRPIG